MPDKLTDNELKKALEDWIKNYDGSYVNFKTLGNALNLINRLQKQNSNLTSDLTSLQKDLTSLQAENERLKDALTDHEYANCVAIENGLIYTHTLEDYDKLIADISSEAYKEFAEEIFELFPADKPNTVISRVTVKHILKELVGEDN